MSRSMSNGEYLIHGVDLMQLNVNDEEASAERMAVLDLMAHNAVADVELEALRNPAALPPPLPDSSAEAVRLVVWRWWREHEQWPHLWELVRDSLDELAVAAMRYREDLERGDSREIWGFVLDHWNPRARVYQLYQAHELRPPSSPTSLRHWRLVLDPKGMREAERWHRQQGRARRSSRLEVEVVRLTAQQDQHTAELRNLWDEQAARHNPAQVAFLKKVLAQVCDAFEEAGVDPERYAEAAGEMWDRIGPAVERRMEELA